MQRKRTVAVLFGGKSVEHEVSLLSATNVVNALDRAKYELVLVGIDRSGSWWLCDEVGPLPGRERVALVLDEARGRLIDPRSGTTRRDFDVLFPVLHGPYGEDGSIQGLARLTNVPCVGSGLLGSAIGLDKDVCKRLLRDAGLAVTPFITLRHGRPDEQLIRAAVETLGFPLFVKPASSGSSVGVAKVDDLTSLNAAVRDAFQFDTKVLMEAAVRGREIECAVLGNEAPAVSVPGEIIPKAQFYTYDAKYQDADGAELRIPAALDPALAAEVQRVALRSFEATECAGMARVDMFVTDDGRVLVNELNTIPGFTQISMYPKLWEASGLSYAELLDRLITLACEEFESHRKLKVDRA